MRLSLIWAGAAAAGAGAGAACGAADCGAAAAFGGALCDQAMPGTHSEIATISPVATRMSVPLKILLSFTALRPSPAPIPPYMLA